MSAIAKITAALDLDARDVVLANGGSFADLCAVAAAMYASAPLGDETAPESCRTVAVRSDEGVATVRPGKWI